MVTGGGAMFLNDAVRAEKRLTPIFNQHEQACAIAAEGYVRAGNGMGVVNVTTGPGGTNALTGVIGQWLDSIPVIYISGQVKVTTSLYSCPDLHLRQLGDQEINILDIVRPVTKYAAAVLNPLDIRRELETSLYHAFSGRQGPVWLDIPLNIQNATIDPDTLEAAILPDIARPVPSEPAMCDVRDRLRAAKRPAIIAGHGIRRAGAEQDFLILAEALGIPVLTTFNGFDLIPSDHPLFCGRIGTIGNRSGNFVLQNADLLLSVGSRNNIRQISYNWENFGKNAEIISVDIDAAELRKPTVVPHVGICADARAFIVALYTLWRQIPFQTPTDWLSWCQERLRRFPLTPEVPPVVPDGLVDAYWFMASLTAATPADVITVAGNGTACVALFQSGKIKPEQRIFWNSGCASMGYDLPAAIGAATAGRKSICVAGDGSIQMNLAELQTVLNHRLPVKIFLLENNGYSSIRQTQNAFFGGARIGCDPSSGIQLPNMIKLANAYGFRTLELSSHTDLEKTIADTLNGDDPALCVVHLGENEFSPKLSSRTHPDGSIVSSSLEDMAPFLSFDDITANMISKKDDDHEYARKSDDQTSD